eukprot:jgi/Botrbrau1/825/Bobra.0352s0022.1
MDVVSFILRHTNSSCPNINEWSNRKRICGPCGVPHMVHRCTCIGSAARVRQRSLMHNLIQARICRCVQMLPRLKNTRTLGHKQYTTAIDTCHVHGITPKTGTSDPQHRTSFDIASSVDVRQALLHVRGLETSRLS